MVHFYRFGIYPFPRIHQICKDNVIPAGNIADSIACMFSRFGVIMLFAWILFLGLWMLLGLPVGPGITVLLPGFAG